MGLTSVVPLVQRGSKKLVEHHHMWRLPRSLATANAWEEFEPYWKEQLQLPKYVHNSEMPPTTSLIAGANIPHFNLIFGSTLESITLHSLTTLILYLFTSDMELGLDRVRSGRASRRLEANSSLPSASSSCLVRFIQWFEAFDPLLLATLFIEKLQEKSQTEKLTLCGFFAVQPHLNMPCRFLCPIW